MTRDEFLVALVADITDRRGLKHEWNSLDDDVKAEILATWGGLTDRLLAAARAEALEEALAACGQSREDYPGRIYADPINGIARRIRALVKP